MVSVVVASGCNTLLGIDDLSLRDGAVLEDTLPEFCYGMASKACFPAAPTGLVTLSGTLDTASDPRCSAGPTCAIGADSIVVDALTVSGNRPLVLVAVTTLTIANRLDANSTASRLGPGANSPACNAPSPAAAAGTSGGGAGGSFGGSGAAGGKGGGGGGAAGGTPGAIQTATALRGGCPGGPGAGTALGVGGHGGGALALYAGVSIQINNDVRVSGTGGTGGQSASSGGGGGGSGGMIVLEAPSIDVVNGDVFANGGGGGEGATSSGPGDSGKEATAYDGPASGGSNNNAGDGGAGFALGAPPGDGKSAGSGGGGGGGGGAGVIWVHGTVTGTKLSPTVIPR